MRVVILGTGTEVGKTFTTTLFARGLRSHGRVLALKPIETGVVAGQDGDAGAIAAAAGHPPHLSPWRFARPVSPHLAARLQGSAIDPLGVASWVEEREAQAEPRFTLIESAGGAFSPLAPGATNVELALALQPARWLLVAPDALGVLHDLGATLRALPRPPDAVVLSSSRPADASSGSNAAELAGLGVARVLTVLEPRSADASALVRWLIGV